MTMEEGLKDRIDKDRLPHHIAIIMDGNGRWAEEKGQDPESKAHVQSDPKSEEV